MTFPIGPNSARPINFFRTEVDFDDARKVDQPAPDQMQTGTTASCPPESRRTFAERTAAMANASNAKQAADGSITVTVNGKTRAVAGPGAASEIQPKIFGSGRLVMYARKGADGATEFRVFDLFTGLTAKFSTTEKVDQLRTVETKKGPIVVLQTRGRSETNIPTVQAFDPITGSVAYKMPFAEIKTITGSMLRMSGLSGYHATDLGRDLADARINVNNLQTSVTTNDDGGGVTVYKNEAGALVVQTSLETDSPVVESISAYDGTSITDRDDEPVKMNGDHAMGQQYDTYDLHALEGGTRYAVRMRFKGHSYTLITE